MTISKLIRRSNAFFAVTIVLLLTFIGSCKEPLPPRNDPSDILQGTIEGLYALTASENTLKVILTIRNTYDETLQDTAYILGSFRIILARDSSYHKSITIADTNLIEGTYNRNTGVLTMDPNTIIRLRYTWNFIDDYGRDLRRNIFQYQPDPNCADRKIALKEFFFLQSSVRVYRKTTTVAPPATLYPLCHVDVYVDPRSCPPIRTDIPCE
ncbi:MAG: hypothetical protein HY033_09435 [Ignavibacteriae bacterium]|nr:hypothetical protein [Ignavibacteria bacterium]MBI3365115.1 hypothetical protein [Ignavibacteriota bacterium]